MVTSFLERSVQPFTDVVYIAHHESTMPIPPLLQGHPDFKTALSCMAVQVKLNQQRHVSPDFHCLTIVCILRLLKLHPGYLNTARDGELSTYTLCEFTDESDEDGMVELSKKVVAAIVDTVPKGTHFSGIICEKGLISLLA